MVVATWNAQGSLTAAKKRYLLNAADHVHAIALAVQEARPDARLPESWRMAMQVRREGDNRTVTFVAVQISAWRRHGYEVEASGHTDGCAWMRLVRGAQHLVILSVHLAHDPHVRTNQLREIGALLDATPNAKIVAMGDFNATRTTADCTGRRHPCLSFTTAFPDDAWHDAVRISHPNGVLFSRAPTGQSWSRLDYVLTRNVDTRWGKHAVSTSDHHLVAAGLRLGRDRYGGVTQRRMPRRALFDDNEELADTWWALWCSTPGRSPLDRWDAFKAAAVDAAIAWADAHPENATVAFEPPVGIGDDWADDVHEAAKQLHAEVQRESEEDRKVWVEEWGKVTRLFFQTLKGWTPPPPVRALSTDGIWERDPHRLHDTVAAYFATVYERTVPAPDAATLSEWTPTASLPPLDIDCLGHSPTESEIDDTINSMASWKAPGIDGWPVKAAQLLHRHHPDVFYALIPALFAADRTWPQSERMSVTVAIPKKHAAATEVANLRPLSLTAIGYRVLSKLLANRTARFAPKLLPTSQVGFVRGRVIFENYLAMQAWLDNGEDDSQVFMVDFAKAFDTVPHWLVHHVLRHHKLPAEFRNVIKRMYEDCSATVKLNGRLGGRYNVCRGVKQGCALSPLLFSLAIQPLLNMFDRRLAGIRIGCGDAKIVLKYRAYADDVAVFLTGADDTNAASRIMQKWEATTGMMASPSKSATARPRRRWGRVDGLPPVRVTNGNVVRLVGRATYDYLGFVVARAETVGARIEWKRVFEKMSARVARIGMFKLTMAQRVLALRFLIASMASHRAFYLPVNGTTAKAYNRITQAVVWAGARARRTVYALENTEADGGMNVPTLETMATARRTSMAVKEMLRGRGSVKPRFITALASLWLRRRTTIVLRETPIAAVPWERIGPMRPPWYILAFRMMQSMGWYAPLCVKEKPLYEHAELPVIVLGQPPDNTSRVPNTIGECIRVGNNAEWIEQRMDEVCPGAFSLLRDALDDMRSRRADPFPSDDADGVAIDCINKPAAPDASVKSCNEIVLERLQPVWLTRAPHPDNVDVNETRVVRKAALRKAKAETRIVNGGDNKVWMTRERCHKFGFHQDNLCSLCGTHAETHASVDTDCPVAAIARDEWRHRNGINLTRDAEEMAWLGLVPKASNDRVTTSVIIEAIKWRAALWKLRWQKTTRTTRTLFPGRTFTMPASILLTWTNDVRAKLRLAFANKEVSSNSAIKRAYLRVIANRLTSRPDLVLWADECSPQFRDPPP